MKHVLLILLSWLLVLPVGAAETQSPRTALVADEGLQGHLDYLTGRLQLLQFAAIDTLLDSLAVGQREYLLCQLLATLNSQPRATSPQLLAGCVPSRSRPPAGWWKKRWTAFWCSNPPTTLPPPRGRC